MRTITIKYPNLEYTLPTISAQAGGFEGSDDSIFLALVNGKPSFAVLADIEGEAHDMVLNFPMRIPVGGIERRFNGPQPAELHGVEFKELTNADIIALANLPIPEWDAHYSDSWEHTFTVLAVDPVIVAAMHANEGVWTEEVQTDWGEITASYTTVDGDGTEYMVLTPAEYSQYEDDQARDQLVDRIDEMEDGVLKSLIRRNESALIADFKNMPEFDPKYSTSIGVASHDFYVIELD